MATPTNVIATEITCNRRLPIFDATAGTAVAAFGTLAISAPPYHAIVYEAVAKPMFPRFTTRIFWGF
jgi:hypothetical protein